MGLGVAVSLKWRYYIDTNTIIIFQIQHFGIYNEKISVTQEMVSNAILGYQHQLVTCSWYDIKQQILPTKTFVT